MPLPLTVSCSSKIQIGFAFLVQAHLGSPGKMPLNGCVCVIRIVNYKAKFDSISFHFVGKGPLFTKTLPPFHFLPTGLLENIRLQVSEKKLCETRSMNMDNVYTENGKVCYAIFDAGGSEDVGMAM